MGALIFFMAVAICGCGITAVVFGIQVLCDHSNGRTTAWSKKSGYFSIVLGLIVSAVLGIMLIIAVFDL